MFFKKKNFENKSLQKVSVSKKPKISFKQTFRVFLVILLLSGVVYFWNTISYAVGNYVKNLAWVVAKNIAKATAKAPTKDAL
jgi:hypothetical protein